MYILFKIVQKIIAFYYIFYFPGGGQSDATEIKAHHFFRSINWDLLAKKQISAPFVPIIRNELDTNNFSEEFTTLPVTDSPAAIPPNPEKLFRGYSYVSPSILLSKNVISDDILRIDDGNCRPDPLKVHRYRVKGSPFFIKYDLISNNPIGDGSFSIVMKCQRRSTKETFAVKIIKSSHDCSEEIKTLRRCQSMKNIVKFIEVLKDAAYTYIIMELLDGGELLERIRKARKFTEDEASELFSQIVDAVSFMHSHNIAHRDLKPENILFQRKDSSLIKIVDFGFAKFQVPSEGMNTPCFTLDYAAPEVLLGSNTKTYTEACDLWSLGVILYTMLCGQSPFLPKNNYSHEESINLIVDRIRRGSFDTETEAWDIVSPEAKCLVRGLLSVDISKRLTMPQLKNHKWFQCCRRHFIPATPLHGPTDMASLEINVRDAFDAFKQAERQGFCLQDVNNAKLAQRRRLKRSSSSTNDSEISELGRSKSSSGIAISDQNNRSISINSDIEIVGEFTENVNTNDIQLNNNKLYSHPSSNQVVVISDEDSCTASIRQSAETEIAYFNQRLSVVVDNNNLSDCEDDDFLGFHDADIVERALPSMLLLASSQRLSSLSTCSYLSTDNFLGFDDKHENDISKCKVLEILKYLQSNGFYGQNETSDSLSLLPKKRRGRKRKSQASLSIIASVTKNIKKENDFSSEPKPKRLAAKRVETADLVRPLTRSMRKRVKVDYRIDSVSSDCQTQFRKKRIK